MMMSFADYLVSTFQDDLARANGVGGVRVFGAAPLQFSGEDARSAGRRVLCQCSHSSANS
jgi:multidrug efflux pump